MVPELIRSSINRVSVGDINLCGRNRIPLCCETFGKLTKRSGTIQCGYPRTLAAEVSAHLLPDTPSGTGY